MIKRMSTVLSLLGFTICLFANPLSAEKKLIDRIVAVVGDDVILEGELLEHLYIASQQAGISLQDSVELIELKNQILDGLITEKVILQRAKEKDISVSDEEVDAAIDKDLETVRSRFTSDEEFQAALSEEGLTLTSYRDGLREERKKQLLQDKFMRELKLPPKHVSDSEVREYFEANQDKLGMRPATVTLAHIMIAATLTDEELKRKGETVDEILERLAEGDKFEDLAREYSDDLSTKDRGGDIGFLERGDMLPVIERYVFLLNPGEVSGAIKTEVGYFIVKLEEIRLGKVHLKQILLSTTPDEDDEIRAEQLAHELVMRLRDGEDFGQLAAQYSTDRDTKTNGGLLGEFTNEDISERYVGLLENLDAGDVSEPIEAPGGWEIVKLLEKKPPRPFEYEDVEANIRQGLAQEKAFSEFIEKMKDKTYIEIRL